MDATILSLPEGDIRLRDGRWLAYAEYGDPQGKPIFFFHGTPGSRLFHHPDNSVASSAGARIIAVDRPGFGRSDFKPGRTLLDWPNDVVQLADALNIGRFAVMGYSGGGPYAAACASAIPDRLTAAGLISSISPLDTPEITKGMHGLGHTFFSLERHLPPLAGLTCRLMCTIWRSNPDLYFKAQLNGLYSSKEAQAMLPVMKAMLTADFLEAVRGGSHAITCDLEILARPWGFQLHVIPADVFVWHGEDDTQAPLAMGKRLAGAIPHCRATFYPGEGHWAIYCHWQEILTALARAEATIRIEPQPKTMAAAQSINSDSMSGISTAIPDTEDLPTDSVQGLQPAREALQIVAAEETQGITTKKSATGVSLEGEPAQGVPKPVSKKMAKQRSPAQAEAPAAVFKREPVKVTAKPVSKNTDKTRTSAIADKPAVVPAEPEPAQESPEPVSKKTNGRRSVAVVEPQRKAAGKTGKRTAAATTEAKPPTDAARASAKKSAKPKAAAVERPSAVVIEEPVPAPEEPEPVSAKSSSRRRAAKEAVLV